MKWKFQADHPVWMSWKSRVFLGGIAVFGIATSVSSLTHAEDKGGSRRDRQSQPHAGRTVHTPQPSVATPPRTTTAASSGFHPQFQHVAPQTSSVVVPRVAISTGNSTQTAGSNRSPRRDLQARHDAQEIQHVAFLQKDKEKQKKPEPKPRVERPNRNDQPKQGGNNPRPPEVRQNNPPPVVHQPKIDVPRPKVERPHIERPKLEKPQIEKSVKPVTPATPIKPVTPVQPKVNDRVPDIRITKPDRGRGDVEGGKGKIELPKPGADISRRPDRDDSKNVGQDGKIKIREPHDKPAGGVPKLEHEKRDANQLGVGAKEKIARMKDGQTLPRDQILKTKRDVNLQQSKLKDGKPVERVKLNVTPELKHANAERLKKLPREQMKLPVAKNGKVDRAQIERLKLHPARDTFNERLKTGELNRFSHLKSGHTFQMQRQFALHQSGDISRRMNLLPALQARGGWRHRHFGVISPFYARHCRSMWYAGPSFCGPYLWYPTWRPWVDWCWWDTCSPIYDPRPMICRPVIYNPCSPWGGWRHPVWQPLSFASCGTWVDVPPVVINDGADVQLLATRFVDPGHPDQELGPRFRVWFRNNSPFPVNQPFNVLLVASTDANAYAGLPEAGVRVTTMAPGETQVVDIRLPFAANFLGRDSQGGRIPFSHLNVFVDSHNELPEVNEANNGASVVRGDILPVDPVIFAADPSHIEPNGVVHMAGEGFGPEPGKAVIVIGEQEFDAEILGWFDLGVQIRIPDFAVTEPTAADLVIVRGDGAASQPLTIEIDPAKTDSAYEQPSPGPDASEEGLPPVPPRPMP